MPPVTLAYTEETKGFRKKIFTDLEDLPCISWKIQNPFVPQVEQALSLWKSRMTLEGEYRGMKASLAHGLAISNAAGQA